MARKPKATKFKLEFRSIRDRLDDRIKVAEGVVKAGQRAVKSFGTGEVGKGNRASLADAKNALANLKLARQALKRACCNQRENCDPIFGL